MSLLEARLGARAARLAVLRMDSPDPVGFGIHAVEPRRVALKSMARVRLPLVLGNAPGGPRLLAAGRLCVFGFQPRDLAPCSYIVAFIVEHCEHRNPMRTIFVGTTVIRGFIA
jgi:hypothetical protein